MNASASDFAYRFTRRTPLEGVDRHGHYCRLLVHRTEFVVVIEFEDGAQAVVNRNSIRRIGPLA